MQVHEIAKVQVAPWSFLWSIMSRAWGAWELRVEFRKLQWLWLCLQLPYLNLGTKFLPSLLFLHKLLVGIISWLLKCSTLIIIINCPGGPGSPRLAKVKTGDLKYHPRIYGFQISQTWRLQTYTLLCSSLFIQ